MKAMALTGLRQMAMIEVPFPAIQKPNEVLLRLTAVGVCGSDIHYYTKGRIGSQVVHYPYRVGHECAAVVEAVGASVHHLKPGDSVAVDPAMWCGQCDQCQIGRYHTCRNLRFLGCPGQAEGCLAEAIVMPAASCFKTPPTMSPELAALVEPLAIGVYAASLAAPLMGRRIAILGAGPIGLSVLLAAREQGAARIYVTDPLLPRRTAAQQAGADWTGSPGETDIVAAIAQREPLLLDAVFECCGQQEALDQGGRLLKPGGTLFIVGIPETDRVIFDIDTLRRRELTIRNVRRQNEKTAETIAKVAEGRLHPEFMITHRFSFAETPKAFDLVAAYADGVIKAMILMDVR